MRNTSLHATLEAFAADAAGQLAAETASGAEIPFEVVEEPGARASLYCYRPLTGAFIRERLGMLARAADICAGGARAGRAGRRRCVPAPARRGPDPG